MNTFTNRRLAVMAVVGLGASLGPIGASATTPPTEPPIPPIAVEEFTRLDAETLVRGAVTDDVTATITINREGMDEMVLDLADLSNVAVADSPCNPAPSSPGTPTRARSSSTSPRANSST